MPDVFLERRLAIRVGVLEDHIVARVGVIGTRLVVEEVECLVRVGLLAIDDEDARELVAVGVEAVADLDVEDAGVLTLPGVRRRGAGLDGRLDRAPTTAQPMELAALGVDVVGDRTRSPRQHVMAIPRGRRGVDAIEDGHAVLPGHRRG